MREAALVGDPLHAGVDDAAAARPALERYLSGEGCDGASIQHVAPMMLSSLCG